MSYKFIVLYGINNLGKTTQAKELVDRLKSEGEPAWYLKYAVYNLVPSGPALNAYLRGGNPHGLSPREFQLIQALNRTQHQGVLSEMLSIGHVVCEDYVGTSIAWGAGAGVDIEFLVKINSHLREPDVALLFEGQRFPSGIESSHCHESDPELTEKVRKIHLSLAGKFGWVVINANNSPEVVHEEIWNIVSRVM